MGKQERLEEAARLTDEGVLHSRITHGDTAIHHDCVECRRIARAILEAFDITPQQYTDSFDRFKEMKRYRGLKPLGLALVNEEGGSAWDQN